TARWRLEAMRPIAVRTPAAGARSAACATFPPFFARRRWAPPAPVRAHGAAPSSRRGVPHSAATERPEQRRLSADHPERSPLVFAGTRRALRCRHQRSGHCAAIGHARARIYQEGLVMKSSLPLSAASARPRLRPLALTALVCGVSLAAACGDDDDGSNNGNGGTG